MKDFGLFACGIHWDWVFIYGLCFSRNIPQAIWHMACILLRLVIEKFKTFQYSVYVFLLSPCIIILEPR